MQGHALLEIAASGLLVGVALAGLRRFRARRFRPARERVGALSRSAEALLFAALLLTGAAGLAVHVLPGALPGAVEAVPACAAGIALAPWLLSERLDARALAGSLLALASALLARFDSVLDAALG